ncbi:MAG: sigma-54-dependent Fis family transcriptional regulator, partial [Rhodospirillaceae bacterium]|nr:sigma-54-dependent Fis family transcriptional regulator [Rhodospirillaceae bacterium]
AEERSFRGFDADARAHLREYSWPGNVRELENVVRNVVVLNDGGIATADMLPVGMNADMLPVPANDPVKIRTSEGTTRPLHDIERDAIQAALDACDGHVPRAAALLQISPSTIYRKMQGWGEDSAVS